MKSYITAGLLLINSIAIPAHANTEIQEQLDNLDEKILQLEKRITQLEYQNTGTTPTSQQDGSRQSDTTANPWMKLKLGLNYTQVENLLGKPHVIHKGAVEFWFYSKQGNDGPYVKFLFSKVDAWKQP